MSEAASAVPTGPTTSRCSSRSPSRWRLAIENLLGYEEIAALKARLEEENVYLQEEVRTEAAFGDVVGESPAMLDVLASVRKVAKTDSTVLVMGETGTGKELIVRAIHDLSRRKDKLLVKVNCAALPAGVIESELFGHEKGAFTGALLRESRPVRARQPTARSSSTRSATFRWSCRRSSCACCRRASSSASAGRRR